MIHPPDLSLVIVSFQVRELLDQCLSSLHDLKSALSLEVFVVDNASNDGTADRVRKHYPWTIFIANSENRGFSAASNQGLKRASGRYVMLLNPDTRVPLVQPNALGIIVGFMDAHPLAGACGPRLEYADGTFQHSAFHFPSLAQVYLDLFPANWRLLDSRLNGRYPRQRYDKGKPFQVDHPLGAAFLVRTEAVRRIGWLDEGFFIYAEEIDWALRLRRAGWQIWCVPAAKIIHYEAQSTHQSRDAMFVQLWRSRFHLFRKHYGRPFNLAASWIVRAGMRHASNSARRSFISGQIGDVELRMRLEAFDKILQLSRQRD